ncbi:MAG: protein-L-isoaspartate(D-aspartate) O-methyltransferase [Candidatus Omnitrophica bacterium]|nr:protein-L-isoaspartate(D-aspartate) O-methyltransferase [Candidatus Omnitrophota bacterium]
MDYAILRERMVEDQLVARGIHDEYVLAAFKKVPRHMFIPVKFEAEAYEDHPVQIGFGQTISQPYMVALMTELCKVTPEANVLEIGTGSGYQLAILCELANEVHSIEKVGALAENVKSKLGRLGYSNFYIEEGDGSLGLERYAPYDAIVVTAAAPSAPKPLIEQLKDKGRLVIPIGSRLNQMLTLIEKIGGVAKSQDICYCAFVPLLGKYGFTE